MAWAFYKCLNLLRLGLSFLIVIDAALVWAIPDGCSGLLAKVRDVGNLNKSLKYKNFEENSFFFKLQGKGILRAAEDGGSPSLADNEALQLAFRAMIRVEFEYLKRGVLSKQKLSEFLIQEQLGEMARASEDFAVFVLTGKDQLPLTEIIEREYSVLFDKGEWKEISPYLFASLALRFGDARPSPMEFDEIRAASVIYLRPKYMALGDNRRVDLPDEIKKNGAIWSRLFVDKIWASKIRELFLAEILEVLKKNKIENVLVEVVDRAHGRLMGKFGFRALGSGLTTVNSQSAGGSQFMVASVKDIRRALKSESN